MRMLTPMMLLMSILSSCKTSIDLSLNHTEKTYSPVFYYFENGNIDGARSYCIVSAQYFSINGHEFLDVKTKEPISSCDRAIGYKGSGIYEFFNIAAKEIRKGAGLKSSKLVEPERSINSSENEWGHFANEADSGDYQQD